MLFVQFGYRGYNYYSVNHMAMDYHRILVPVAGTTADDEALKLACSLSRKGKTKIWVMYVVIQDRSLPVDAEVEPEIRKGEEILDHMESVAEDLGFEISTDFMQAREAGPTIVDAAAENNVDLIIMGIKYKQRLGQFSLGSVVPYVLKNAHCRVILYQQ
jgi:nucleotide-binding universal stress UspA family protein